MTFKELWESRLMVRVGTDDISVLREVLTDNCYRLPDRMDGQTVLDVGAHIGTFALACLTRGASRVVCYEPEAENFSLLSRHVGRRADCRNAALWAGPKKDFRLGVRNYPGTGSHSLTEGSGCTVEIQDVDDVLRELGVVDIMKLDCEGAEYAILYCSRELSRVRQIVGEAHGTPEPGCNMMPLVGRLGNLGYSVRSEWIKGMEGVQGYFFAERRD